MFITTNYKLVVRDYPSDDLPSWRQRMFAVIHRHYDVCVSVHTTLHEGIIVTKASEEATGAILANSHKSIKELTEGPPANVPLMPKLN